MRFGIVSALCLCCFGASAANLELEKEIAVIHKKVEAQQKAIEQTLARQKRLHAESKSFSELPQQEVVPKKSISFAIQRARHTHWQRAADFKSVKDFTVTMDVLNSRQKERYDDWLEKKTSRGWYVIKHEVTKSGVPDSVSGAYIHLRFGQPKLRNTSFRR